MKQIFFYAALTIIFLICFPSASFASLIELEQTEYIHFNTPVADSHIDTMMEVIHEETLLPQTDIGDETNFHFDIPKAEAGGVNVPFLAAYTSGYQDTNSESISKTLANIYGIIWSSEQNPDKLQLAAGSEEIREIIYDNKMAAVSTIEGAYSMDEHNAIGLLHQYQDLGVRMIGLHWNYSNALGEGASRVYGDAEQTPSDGGLTVLGAEVVKEMNALGMIVDVSHMARETFWDVIEVSEAPVIASHSGVNALKDHQRNLTDEQLVALKENGGIVSIVYYPAFLTDGEMGYVSDIADHIDYAVDLIGIDHVGLGSDYDGAPMPEDLQDVSQFPRIIEELAFRGYTKQEIEKILGENILRVLEEVENIAKSSVLDSEYEVDIQPHIQMGEAISTRTPLLSAEIGLHDRIELESIQFRILVDGVSYEPDFDEDTATLSVQLPEALEEKFHVVTFEVEDENGDVSRETRIFYIQE